MPETSVIYEIDSRLPSRDHSSFLIAKSFLRSHSSFPFYDDIMCLVGVKMTAQREIYWTDRPSRGVKDPHLATLICRCTFQIHRDHACSFCTTHLGPRVPAISSATLNASLGSSNTTTRSGQICSQHWRFRLLHGFLRPLICDVLLTYSAIRKFKSTIEYTHVSWNPFAMEIWYQSASKLILSS